VSRGQVREHFGVSAVKFALTQCVWCSYAREDRCAGIIAQCMLSYV